MAPPALSAVINPNKSTEILLFHQDRELGTLGLIQTEISATGNTAIGEPSRVDQCLLHGAIVGGSSVAAALGNDLVNVVAMMTTRDSNDVERLNVSLLSPSFIPSLDQKVRMPAMTSYPNIAACSGQSPSQSFHVLYFTKDLNSSSPNLVELTVARNNRTTVRNVNTVARFLTGTALACAHQPLPNSRHFVSFQDNTKTLQCQIVGSNTIFQVDKTLTNYTPVATCYTPHASDEERSFLVFYYIGGVSKLYRAVWNPRRDTWVHAGAPVAIGEATPDPSATGQMTAVPIGNGHNMIYYTGTGENAHVVHFQDTTLPWEPQQHMERTS